MPEGPPPGWGSDTLSDFVERARRNSFATFSNLRPHYQRLRDIDGAYRRLIEYLDNSPDWFAGFFVLRAHCAFLASCRLAISGQVAEGYMTLRGCIEAGLYGLYLSRHPESQRVWLERHADEAGRAACRSEFTIRRLLGYLESESSQCHQETAELYERTIDYGAHPNERALLSNLAVHESPENVSFQLTYLVGETQALGACLRTTAQVGVCALDIFALIYPERISLIGLSETLDRLRSGL